MIAAALVALAFVRGGDVYTVEDGHVRRVARGAAGDVSAAPDGGAVAFVRRGRAAIAGVRAAVPAPSGRPAPSPSAGTAPACCSSGAGASSGSS